MNFDKTEVTSILARSILLIRKLGLGGTSP